METLLEKQTSLQYVLNCLNKYRTHKPRMLPTGWKIQTQGLRMAPEGTTMRVWIHCTEYTIPFCMGYATVIMALGHMVKRSSIIIVYVYNHKNIATVVALKNK